MYKQNHEQANWGVVAFPVTLRRSIVAQAKAESTTTPALIQGVVENWLKDPVIPTTPADWPDSSHEDSAMWMIRDFPVGLRNRFTAMGITLARPVHQLLEHVVAMYLQTTQVPASKEKTS